MIDFCAIDFETATFDRHSACEIGICIVENNQIIDTQSWLIKPPSFPHFNRQNIAVHGIYPSDVANSPTFGEIWQKIQSIIKDKIIIAHNASFDAGVLRSCLDYYKITKPYSKYLCSIQIAKKSWQNYPSYSLGNLAQIHKINFQHHRAGADAKVCAQLSLKAFRELNIENTNDVEEYFKKNIKIL